MVKRGTGRYDNEDDGSRKRSRISHHPAPSEAGECTVFVGNLAFETSWQDLKDHMRQAGNVDSANIMQSSHGRSKGCGLVTYQKPFEAKRAVKDLNESTLRGRTIFVSPDNRSSDNRSKASGGGGGGGNRNVYVGNLSFDCSWQDLKDYFRQCGTVDHVEIMESRDGKYKKGYALVSFKNPNDASKAIHRFHAIEFQGRRLEVRWDREAKSSAGSGGDCGGGSDTQLFVGNLSFECSWQDLKDHFKKCGKVERVEIPEGPDGRKKGFGLVTFASSHDANTAIRRIDGMEFQNRKLEVRLDKKSAAPAFASAGDTQLFVGNLSFDCSWQDLKDHFKQCGRVDHSEVVEGPDGRKKGFGIIRYGNAKDAQDAIRRLNGVEFQGRQLEVRLDKKRAPTPGGGGKEKRSENPKHEKPKPKQPEEPFDRQEALNSGLKSAR